jgi:hypothetical protein
MIKRKSVGSKYVIVPTNNRSAFSRRAEIAQIKFSDIPSGNLKANSFQKIRAEFRAKASLNKEKYMEKETIKTEGCKFLRSNLWTSICRRKRISNNRGIIQFIYLFIYVLSSTANGQLQRQHECIQQ